MLTLLALGLGALLVLNTVLAQGSFRVEDLQRQVAVLADDEQALQQQVAELAAPGRLSHQARMLGMVPMTNPAFLRTSDGKVLGRAAPATGLVPEWARPVVVHRPAPPATQASPKSPTPDGTAATGGSGTQPDASPRARQPRQEATSQQTGTSSGAGQGSAGGDGGGQR